MIHKEAWYKEAAVPRPLSMEKELDLLIQKHLHSREAEDLQKAAIFGIRSLPGRKKIVDTLATLSKTSRLTKYETKVMWKLSNVLPEYPSVSASDVLYCPWKKYLPEVKLYIEESKTETDEYDEPNTTYSDGVEKLNLKTFLARNYRRRGGDLIWDSLSSHPYYSETHSGDVDDDTEFDYYIRLVVPTPQKRKQLFAWWEESV